MIGDVYGMMKPVILRIMEAHKTRRTFETGTFREHEGVVDALAARTASPTSTGCETHLEANFLRFEAAEAAHMRNVPGSGTFPGEEPL